MAPIVVSVEVDRSAEDAFAFATDPAQFVRWQCRVLGSDRRALVPGASMWVAASDARSVFRL